MSVRDLHGLPRQRMVADLQAQGIQDPAVLTAMGQVPREAFVPEALRGKAYRSDVSLPIGDKQTISQPWIVARMCELAEPGPQAKVLEVGTGSGYHAAVLSRLFGRVYTVERIPALSNRARGTIRNLGIENVHFKIFDGSYGWGEFAPYRAIVVTAAAPRVPEPLLDQLEDGGCLVLPVGSAARDEEQILTRVRKSGATLRHETHGACRFVPLVGKFGVPS